MTKKKHIGQLMKNARRMCGLSMDSLCELLDGRISKQTISNYERGAYIPTSEFLDMFVKVLHLPLGYFSDQTTELHGIQLRVDGKLSARDLRRLEAVAKSELSKHLTLEKQLCIRKDFSNPISSFVIYNNKDIDDAIEILRDNWRISYYAIPFLCDTVENTGIIVLEIDFDNNDFSGLCGKIKNTSRPFIVFKKNMTIERIRFTVAHELGHLLLNLSEQIENIEKPCNYFAGALILSEKAIEKEIGGYRERLTLEELISIKERYGSSVAATVHRLYDLDLISRKYYDHLYDDVIKKNRMEEGWGKYPINDRPQYYKQMYRRAASMGIRKEDNADSLEITIL